MDSTCKTCGWQMELKLQDGRIKLHWCGTCGTCRLQSPDIETFVAWWVPLREGLQSLGSTQ